MLFYETVDKKTLELLKSLLAIRAFSELRLCGGTSLALQMGHRKSIDIDLFGKLTADEFTIAKNINALGKVQILKNSENIKIYSINHIKVDIVNYPYPWIANALIVNDIPLADPIDIAAMKLSAIAGRGTKKDFIDLYYLLKRYSLSEMIGFYKRKYQDGSEFMVLKSLSYFDDADMDENPVMLKTFDWKDVKQTIREQIKNYTLT